MDCSLPGSSVYGILQARILAWLAMAFSRGSSWLRDQQTLWSCLVRWLDVVAPVNFQWPQTDTRGSKRLWKRNKEPSLIGKFATQARRSCIHQKCFQRSPESLVRLTIKGLPLNEASPLKQSGIWCMNKRRIPTKRNYKKKKNQILELQNAIKWTKIFLEGFNSTLDQTEERISKLKESHLKLFRVRGTTTKK